MKSERARTGKLSYKWWIGIPPWMIIGAVAILMPLFFFMTLRSIDVQKELAIRLLVEKGDALIRSFEAGARTGAGMRWGGFQLQKLLIETAQQPGIDYLIVTDSQGLILADSDPSLVGESYGTDLDLDRITEKRLEWRQVQNPGGADTFEVYRLILPPEEKSGTSWIIFVGLDMGPINQAREQDARTTILIAVTLLLIGFAGIISLFLAQGYRSAHSSLSRVKALSDSLVENMPMGLVAVDQEGKVMAFNQTAESILRRVAPDVLGKKAEEILPATCNDWLRDLEAQGGILEKEMECPVEGNNMIPLEVIAAALKDEAGRNLGRVILFRDLTEMRHLKDEIERSRRLASLGSLAAGVAHEIRNPLSSIKGFAVYFKERYRENPEDLKTADIMVREVERLNRVIGQLLEFSRPLHMKRERTVLEPLILQSLELIRSQAGEKRIALRRSLPSQAREAETAPAAPTVAMIDPDRMKQVLLNLYLNALGAMAEGGMLTVALRADPEGRRIEIAVSDTGAGIAKEDLPRIFDPYFTTKPSGTGLGLAIVHKIVEAHGGEIRVDSQPGKGTTVSIFLPVADDRLRRQES